MGGGLTCSLLLSSTPLLACSVVAELDPGVLLLCQRALSGYRKVSGDHG